jgi:hypothetical protein
VKFVEGALPARTRPHTEVDCTWFIIPQEGGDLLQLDTRGSKDRAILEKVSQSVQIDESAARELLRLIRRTFPNLESGAAGDGRR